jgi:glycosyltransferase involved in cell wall biosynthesis
MRMRYFEMNSNSEKKVKLIIYANALNYAKLTGVGVYTDLLLRYMSKNIPEWFEVKLLVSHRHSERINKYHKEWHIVKHPKALKILNKLYYVKYRLKSDILFCPVMDNLNIFSICKSNKIIFTVHDLGYKYFDKFYYEKDLDYYKKLEDELRHNKSTYFIAVSESTKNDLMNAYEIDESRIYVTSLGVEYQDFGNFTQEDVCSVTSKYKISHCPFFLSVSRISKKKNVVTLLRAFDSFRKECPESKHHLVLVGPDDHGAEEAHRTAQSLASKNRIHFLGFVDTYERNVLYQAADLYVNISWNEGFGLTSLEAAASNTPSLLSSIAAHKEVMEDGAMYAPPENPHAITRAMITFTRTTWLRQVLLEKANRRVQYFSWENTAKKTWEALLKAYRSQPNN